MERNQVRLIIERNDLSYRWLIARLKEKGVITDKTYLCSTLSGSIVGAKAETIISTSLTILRDYEEKMGVKRNEFS